MQRTIADIQKLRALRATTPKDVTISRAVADALRDVKAAARTQSRVDASIIRNIPQRLHAHIVNTRVARGTVTIDVSDASALYELEHWFRAGGEKHLLSSTIRRVKLQIATARD